MHQVGLAVTTLHMCEYFIDRSPATSADDNGLQLCFAPESPWFLVRKGRYDEAIRSLDRLSDRDVDNRETLSLIQHTVMLERQLDFGSSMWDCFKGTNLRRTEIACVVWSSQIWTQFALSSGTYFFEVA